MVADGAIPASSTPSVNLALILISNPDLNAPLASRCFFFGAACHGFSVVAVFLPPGAVAAVLLAEHDAVEPKANKGRCWEGAGLPVPVQHTSCRLSECNSKKFNANGRFGNASCLEFP